MRATTLSPRQIAQRKATKRTMRFKENRVPRIITFIGRTLEYIYKALERLKNRYKQVKLMTQTATGAGLFTGKIALL